MNTPAPAFFSEITRLHRSTLANFNGVLVVTSVQPGEGASLTAHLLAQRSAEEGKKTLLVDLNLRNMALTERVGLMPRDWDLDAGLKSAEVLELAKKVGNGLYALPAPSDAATVQWLSEPTNASAFFAHIAAKYPQVIVDTTPLTVANRNNADPTVLAAAAHRAVLVVAAGLTPKAKLKQAVQDLKTAGANMLGLVVNDRANHPAITILEGWANGLTKVSPGLSLWLRNRLREARG
ncbi:MAG: hypothetical protein WAX89_03515 [Alphaproteobacteria bacterium]